MKSSFRSRPTSRIAVLTLTILAASLGPVPSASAIAALNPNIDSNLTFKAASVPPTKALITTRKTSIVRSAVPSFSTVSGAPVKILLIGTGASFPSGVMPSGTITTTAVADPFGYGTLAASILPQMVEDIEITPKAVTAVDPGWVQLNLSSLKTALQFAEDNSSDYDAVLLAFPPSSVLDPLTYMEALVSYGNFGSGLSNLYEAIAANTLNTDGPVGGIPLDDDLREQMFAHASLRHKDAVEKFVTRYEAWSDIVELVNGLDADGVPIIAPAGDFTIRDANDNPVSAPTQSIYGLSALPSVITVGAAADFGTGVELSPVTGTGPTMDLRLKPDLLARSDITGFVPAGSIINGWAASAPVTGEKLDWAVSSGTSLTYCDPGGPNTPKIPSGACVLQGSSIVAAAVAAGAAGSLVRQGLPHTKGSRAAGDDELIRSLLQAGSTSGTDLFNSSTDSRPWEEGAGVLSSGVDLINDYDEIPLPTDTISFGEVGYGDSDTLAVTLSSIGDTTPQTTGSALDFGTMLGAAATGEATPGTYDDTGASISSISGGTVNLTLAANEYQGGVYAGVLNLKADDGTFYDFPASVLRMNEVEIQVEHPYGGPLSQQGERVEDATFGLMPAIPLNVGILARAFKYLTMLNANATDNFVRFGVTKGGFVSAANNAEYGTAKFDAPPGFWRYFVVNDYDLWARQERRVTGYVGADDALGIRYAGSGTEAANIPGRYVLVSSLQLCGTDSDIEGPLDYPDGDDCLASANIDGDTDPDSGWCKVSGAVINRPFAYWLYCEPYGYQLPVATASRAVYQAAFDSGEWASCNLRIPPGEVKVDLDAIAGMATAPTCLGTTPDQKKTLDYLWEFKPGAPNCLGPTEKLLAPAGGKPADFTASFGKGNGPTTTSANQVPIGLANYNFKIPKGSTYSDISLSFAYELQNVMVAIRVRGGSDSVGDTSGSFIIASPDVQAPVGSKVRKTGTHFSRYQLQTSGGNDGTVSIILVPTAWSSSQATKHAPRAQICDATIRVKTFGKSKWETDETKFKIDQETNSFQDDVDPSVARIRSRYHLAESPDKGTFEEVCWTCGFDGHDDTWTYGSTWSQESPSRRPGARQGARMAYDTQGDHAILFGGHTQDGVALNDTWKWDGTTWTKLAPTASPPARWGYAVAYDSGQDVVLIHGGTNGSAYFDDTWAFNGTTWTQVATSGSKPEPRAHHAMSPWDGTDAGTDPDHLVLFGGLGDDTIGSVATSNIRFGDTWTLAYSAGSWAWTLRTPSSAPPRTSNHAMAFDDDNDKVVLFGGYDTQEVALSDTYTWDGATLNWNVSLNPGTKPGPRINHAMAFDGSDVVLVGGAAVKDLSTYSESDLASLILFGRPSGTAAFYDAETWKWSGSNWTKATPSAAPSGRADHAMVYDPDHSELVMFGGASGKALGTVHEFDGTTWTQRSPSTAPSPRRDYSVAFDTASDSALLFGGIDSTGERLSDTWKWDGKAWTQLSPVTSPSARSGHAMVYNAAAGLFQLFGGVDALGSPLADTWQFNGTTWIKVAALSSPSARSHHAMAYDSTRGRTVLMGGTDGNGGALGDTWEWTGLTWTSVPISGPSARARHAMTYDSSGAKIVMFGGGNGTTGLLSDTWTYDGVAWLPVSGTGPSPRLGHALAFDDARNKVVLFGGTTGSQALVDSWEFTSSAGGGSWTQVTGAAGSPPPVVGAAVYDDASERVVLFGSLCLGIEPEDASLAIHIPKNTARVDESSALYKVKLDGNQSTSTADGPAYLDNVLRADATSLTASGQEMEHFSAFNPSKGSEKFECRENQPITGALCEVWNNAELPLELPKFMAINGRLFGFVGAGYEAVESAGAKLTWKMEDASDGGAFMSRWARGAQGNLSHSLTVSDFYGDHATDNLNSATLPVVDGWLQYELVNGAPNYMALTVGLHPPGDDDQEITVTYDCTQVNGGTTCA